MAVLIEAISVVINDKDLSGADFKDRDDLLSFVPRMASTKSVLLRG